MKICSSNYRRAFSHLNELALFWYYLFNGSRRNVRGSNNLLLVDQQALSLTLKNVSFKITGNENTVVIEKGARISNTRITISGSRNKLVIGEGCNIGHLSTSSLWIEDHDCQMFIGKGTTIGGATIGVSEPYSKVTIGNDCMFAHGIDIRCGDSHSIIDLSSNQRINFPKDVHIGSHVWIARNAQVLKGVTIGENSVIGTGSVVTKDVPPNSIVAGVPARVLRTGVTWAREKIYREAVTSHDEPETAISLPIN
ncbi:DapH/DapD/GlmU-related protein [Leptolyngbya sp. FACHB-261]|uniref:acyltransferase n=1 Tax=Leptolyngbya sp. FACHB-261 TaxID=2692806 RepID=UPI0016837B13|nr:acyltransferase [Leptolyngbya sp. FACHB-261]MBD2101133.1 acyltransferase [Leptolyngbya sp. FACHB-261]